MQSSGQQYCIDIKNVLTSGLFPDPKVVPSDLQLLVFIPLCNFLPLSVGGVCDLLLSRIWQGEGMAFLGLRNICKTLSHSAASLKEDTSHAVNCL